MRSHHCFDKLVHPKVFGPPGLRSNGIHWFCRHCPIFHPLLWTRARRLAWQWRLQWIYQQISTVAYSQGSSKLWFTFFQQAAKGGRQGQQSRAQILRLPPSLFITLITSLDRMQKKRNQNKNSKGKNKEWKNGKNNRKHQQLQQQLKHAGCPCVSRFLFVASYFNQNFVWY